MNNIKLAKQLVKVAKSLVAMKMTVPVDKNGMQLSKEVMNICNRSSFVPNGRTYMIKGRYIANAIKELSQLPIRSFEVNYDGKTIATNEAIQKFSNNSDVFYFVRMKISTLKSFGYLELYITNG